MSFVEKLDDESMQVFNEASKRPYSQQCVFFLNAFWDEVGSQAEYIYSIINGIFRMADMTAKGCNYIHLYEEGTDVDFDIGLYFFEQLCKFAEQPQHEAFKPIGLSAWAKEHPEFATSYAKSLPVMMTSISRKKELRDKVDINFDGRVSMLEYLLYQYEVSPKLLIERSLGNTDEHEEIRKARLALEEVNKAIAAYEAEKFRLETEAASGTGVKALKATNELAQLKAGPLWERLNKSLITAEAAVRIAIRKFGSNGGGGAAGAGGNSQRVNGALWWMERDLNEKQKKYGKPAAGSTPKKD